MTGYNETYGAYYTKSDIKAQIIEKAKRLNRRLDELDDPTTHLYNAIFTEIVRLETRLNKEYKMDEDAIFTATH